MNNKTDIRWLAAGALGGLALAAFGILRQSSAVPELPETAVASVNGVLVGRDRLDSALARLRSDDAGESGKAAILARLVEEELLVQRGVELGMTESDTEVRNAILNSLIASVTAEADAAAPSDEELKEYLAENAERFSYTASLSVRAWETDRDPVAQEFIAALRTTGSPPAIDGIRAMPDLPAGLASADTLRGHLGPAITAAAAEMPDGSSAVFARRGRWLVIQVVERERGYVTELDAVRNRVLLDYRRNLADEMLADYIDNLRQRADVTLAKP
jgi:hypothetical protein